MGLGLRVYRVYRVYGLIIGFWVQGLGLIGFRG